MGLGDHRGEVPCSPHPGRSPCYQEGLVSVGDADLDFLVKVVSIQLFPLQSYAFSPSHALSFGSIEGSFQYNCSNT